MTGDSDNDETSEYERRLQHFPAKNSFFEEFQKNKSGRRPFRESAGGAKKICNAVLVTSHSKPILLSSCVKSKQKHVSIFSWN